MRAPKLALFLLTALFAGVSFPYGALAQAFKDNTGKEFYVAFGENQGGGEDDNLMQLYLTSKTNTKAHIEVTALGFTDDVTITPGQITTIDLPSGKSGQTVEISSQRGQEETLLHGMSVHITADDKITVYGMNHKTYSTDAFLAFPVDVVGTEYLTMNYPSNSSAYPFDQQVPGEFWVVAVNDSTNVTITPKAQTMKGVAAGSPIQLLMNKGDVYLVEGVSNDPKNDLTGSLIESDEPVALFSGHVRATIPENAVNLSRGGSMAGSRNHLVEQLPPVSAWGDSVLIIRYQATDLPDLVRVIAAEDDDTIKVNGIVSKVLQRGDFYEITQLLNPVSIQGSAPIMVGQYMHTSKNSVFDPPGGVETFGDPALAIAYPVEQFAQSYTFICVVDQGFTKEFVNVITSSQGINSITLDGQLVPSSRFSPFPGTNFFYAQLSLDDASLTSLPAQGTHNITGTQPFGITAYALGPADGYAYVGGTGMKTITPFKTVGLIIDFGDRLLTQPAGGGIYNDQFDSIVSLQNISSDPLVIDGFDTRAGDAGDFTVSVPKPTDFPITLAAGASMNITISFTPKQAYIRRHTTLLSKTEHLHAYVVDVYGRGILDNTQIYSDSTAKRHVDTLDFGIFQNIDPPKDSDVFIANKGEQSVNILSGTISGVNATDFTIRQMDTSGVPVIFPFMLPIGKMTARTTLTFTPNPGMTNGLYQALLSVVPSSGVSRDVVLLAHIFTIHPETITSIAFDSMLLCTEQDQTMTVNNPNDFDVNITTVSLGGANPEQFQIIGSTPITIPAHSSVQVRIRCSPSAPGSYSASVTINCDIPKGFSQTQTFSVVTSQLSSSFWAPSNIHMVANQDVLYPIFAESPMQLFGSPSFTLTLSYDPTHIEDIDYLTDRTHTTKDAFTVVGDTAGYREYHCYTLDNSVISGGMPNDSIPIIYIKFHTHLNPGEDPLTTSQNIAINYTVTFDRGPLPAACILQVNPPGLVSMDSTCSTVGLYLNVYDPTQADIAFINPNPITNASTTLTYFVPTESPTRLDIIDERGNVINTLVSTTQKPGEFQARWNVSDIPAGLYLVRLQTAGQMKSRQALVVH
ncbi:MAG TPA: choice-of-anchor D domain-containing protein [Candidatus Kapabacteria bacterium]|nr:choice-of-anchor D domain-containing protein [Candidatus Kapabacteria bacterium]